MRIALRLCLCLLPLAASAANPRSVALTIQENGNAQISETQDIAPPGPDGLLRIAPLPETLWPASVTATPIERGETFDILSQRFAYDLLDDTALFRAYRGDSITCRKGADSFAGRLASLPDFSSAAPSLVLAAEGQPVRFVPNILDLDSIEFPARPDLARAPALVWQTAPGQAAPAAVQLNYAASGLFWTASHEAILSDDARSIALSTRIHLQNRTVRDFANARIRLALSEKGQFAPLVPDPGDPRAAKAPALRYSADGKSWIPERTAASAAIVATYDLPKPLSLPAGADIFASLASAPSVSVETRLVYDGVRFDRYQRNRRTDWNLGTESSPAVDTVLSFSCPKAAPLPPGEFRLLKGQAEQALEWIGTAWLPALMPRESATLHLGPAAGLSGRRIRTGFTEIVPLKSSEESFEITLENQTPADQVITVIEHLYRGETHEISAASAEHSPVDNDPHAIQFKVPLKAGARKSFTYTVRYTW
ncbi:MAG: hypothetical protein EOM72_10055 [Opitutae bacterium]|nr:hypothetical protein [Opitutae bacterium]